MEKLHTKLKAGNPNVLPRIRAIEEALVKAGIIEDESPISNSNGHITFPREDEASILDGRDINFASSQKEHPWYKKQHQDVSYLTRNKLEIIDDEIKNKRALVEAIDATRNKYNKMRNRDETYQLAREREFKPILDAITTTKRKYNGNIFTQPDSSSKVYQEFGSKSATPATSKIYKEENCGVKFDDGDYHIADEYTQEETNDATLIPEKNNGDRVTSTQKGHQRSRRRLLPLRSKQTLYSRRRYPKCRRLMKTTTPSRITN